MQKFDNYLLVEYDTCGFAHTYRH